MKARVQLQGAIIRLASPARGREGALGGTVWRFSIVLLFMCVWCWCSVPPGYYRLCLFYSLPFSSPGPSPYRLGCGLSLLGVRGIGVGAFGGRVSRRSSLGGFGLSWGLGGGRGVGRCLGRAGAWVGVLIGVAGLRRCGWAGGGVFNGVDCGVGGSEGEAGGGRGGWGVGVGSVGGGEGW